MLNKQSSLKSDQLKISTFFTDSNIVTLLLSQLQQLYTSQYGTQYTFSLTSQTLHLYLYFNKVNTNRNKKDTIHEKQKQIMKMEESNNNNNDNDDGKDEDNSKQSHSHKNSINESLSNYKQQQASCYVLRIGKAFPIQGVRLHILHNQYQPRLFDCRDVLQQVLQFPWDYKCRLITIFQNIDKFQVKLNSRNKNAIAMQQTGQFVLNDLYSTHQLSKFSALDVFEDKSIQDGPLLATTQTHFLTFKNVNHKYNPYKTSSSKLYLLTRACQIQCINQFHYNHKNSQIILTLCKYKTIKNFNQYQKISKRYKLDDPQTFLRNILKNITHFQKININLQTSVSAWKNQPDYDKIKKKIDQSKKLQQKYNKNQYNIQKNQEKEIQNTLIKNYQKIVGFFSERASSYYLIFVHKLNAIYLRQASRPQDLTSSTEKEKQRKKSDKSNDSQI